MSDDDTIRSPRGDALERCGAYELVREIGRGGMGSVWEGRHVALDRRVAVKVLHEEFARDPEMLARFLREGRAAARIDHPNVASVFDVGQDQEHTWLAMELLKGEDLGSLLEREQRLDVARAVDILLPVLSAVMAAHAVGVVHRDLKPGNIFLARDRAGGISPKVVDFGFSKIRADHPTEDLDLTRPDTALGTLSYMPAEQVYASSAANAACDQYALGVTLYRCVTGRLPYTGRSSSETFVALTKGVCPRPSEIVPTLPQVLDDVILRAMRLEAEGRFPSVQAFGAALVPFGSVAARARWAEEFGAAPSPASAAATSAASPPPLATERPASPPLPRTFILVGVGLAVLAALVALLASR